MASTHLKRTSNFGDHEARPPLSSSICAADVLSSKRLARYPASLPMGAKDRDAPASSRTDV